MLSNRSGPYPHSYLPLHFWLDKGLVTRWVKKFPMILRAAWLPRIIRNASGNGGGILLGYMPIVSCGQNISKLSYIYDDKIEDPAHPTDRGAAETLEFAQFKREIYQKVLRRVFATVGQRSRQGEAHLCSDNITRVLQSGILIASLDGEESSYFCACRAANANYPCPKCLVHKSELHRVTKSFNIQTSETMCSVIELASQETSKSSKEKVLQGYGLHDIRVGRSDNILFYLSGTEYFSTFYGTSGSQILTQQHHTTLYIRMILGSGENTYGSCFKRFWKIKSFLDNYHRSKFSPVPILIILHLILDVACAIFHPGTH